MTRMTPSASDSAADGAAFVGAGTILTPTSARAVQHVHAGFGQHLGQNRTVGHCRLIMQYVAQHTGIIASPYALEQRKVTSTTLAGWEERV